MIYKSYLIEQNFSINENLTLFYGENLGLKNLFQKKILFLLISRLLYSKGVLNYLDSAVLISKNFKKKCLFYVAGKIDKDFKDSIPLSKLKKYERHSNIKIFYNVKNIKNLIYKRDRKSVV